MSSTCQLFWEVEGRGQKAEGRGQGACPVPRLVAAGASLKKARADKKGTRTMFPVLPLLPGLLICSLDPAPLLGDCHLLPCYGES